jgi:cyanophycinase-like exopeptidase
VTELADVVDAIPEGCGSIGLLSSDEFTAPARAFDEALLESARGARIACVFCADHRHAALNLRNARRWFARCEVEAGVDVIDALDPHEAGSPGALADGWDILYIAGGSPAELNACLRDSDAWASVEQRWRDGATLAGSSAGAMSLCAHSLVPRPGDDKPMHWDRGLGPLTHFAVAVHARSRTDRWLEKISFDAPVPVVAIDDAVGLVLEAGKVPLIAGTGRVRVL